MSENVVDRFHAVLSELVGDSLPPAWGDGVVAATLTETVEALFASRAKRGGAYERFNSALVYYGVPAVSRSFFDHYLGEAAFESVDAFRDAVARYQEDAIRMFATFSDAFVALSTAPDVEALLEPLEERDLAEYKARDPFDGIERIEGEQAARLGYLPAERVRNESEERAWLVAELEGLADRIEAHGPGAVLALSPYDSRRIETLLRRFGSGLPHGVSSPLFVPDPDELRREAVELGPRSGQQLAELSALQNRARRNLARYLAADFLDVYLATSMRTPADFVAVDRFVETLAEDRRIEPLSLRFFNPTQCWVEDRIAKGLVEAVMLKRASITIYMAQKSDTFGKDSEASVALSQGKAVIVYVPKLRLADGRIDSEVYHGLSDEELARRLLREGAFGDTPVGGLDHEALLSRLLQHEISRLPDGDLIRGVERLWADFDLYGEATRISDPSDRTEARVHQARRRAEYRSWLDSVRAGRPGALTEPLRRDLVRALVAVAVFFEDRARLFREIHPLALQVIQSTGVLNGILVARSVDQCARLIDGLLRNRLDLTITRDDDNYRLVENTTGSAVRVMSRHRLLRHAFARYFPRQSAE